MDTFELIVFGGIAAMFWFFVVLGRWSSRSAADIQDKDRGLRWGVQMEIEERDIAQMLEAQNDHRRQRGLPELTEEEFRARVEEEQLAQLVEAERRPRARNRREASGRERRGF
jgi:uncharacterized protein YqfA (UPF0365 family)